MAIEQATLPTTAQTALPAPLVFLSQLTTRQKLAGMAAAALAIAVLTGLWLWSRTPDYQVLFSNLGEKDGGAIIAALQQQNVPYRFSEGGAAILVPSGQVHDIRLKLASQGLPRGGLVGFELMEAQKLGLSQFAEHINYQRALEGELARSIQSLSAVQGARVHLAIPKQTGFLRDEQKPSASVLVNLRGGRTIEPSQVAGIVHLVASSVPELLPAAVSILDQNGTLLSQSKDSSRDAGLDPNQLKYVEEMEQGYIKRIEQILTPITGPGNHRAQVTAAVDFDQAEQTAETYTPNPADKAAIRSQQLQEQTTREAGAAGVPGALSNQPPVPATAPLTTPAAPGTPTAANQPAPLNASKNSTVNYEVDKTIRHVKAATGTVKRLSVAVVVNHKTEKLPDGKAKTTPLSEAEIKQITDLVREAMGFNKERGDTLNVTSSPFRTADPETLPEAAFWKSPEFVSLAKDVFKYALFAGVALYLLFGVIKPLVRQIAPARSEQDVREVTPEGEDAVVALSGPAAAGALPASFEHKLAQAKELAKNDPKLVASVIKEWTGGGQN